MFLNNMNSCSNTDLEDCKYEPTGINAQFGYNPATTENNGCGCNNNNETCQKLLKEIKIKPEVVDPDDVEMIEDLILTCVNEALRKVDSAQAAELGKFNIPGLM